MEESFPIKDRDEKVERTDGKCARIILRKGDARCSFPIEGGRQMERGGRGRKMERGLRRREGEREQNGREGER